MAGNRGTLPLRKGVLFLSLALLATAALALTRVSQWEQASAATTYSVSLANAGLEEATSSGAPAGWTFQWGLFGRVREPVANGNYAGFLANSSDARAYQEVPISPGQSYQLTARLNIADPNTSSGYLRLTWLDGNGSVLGWVEKAADPSVKGYQQVTVGPVTAPANAKFARPQVRLSAKTGTSGLLYFDDVSLAVYTGDRLPTPTPSPSPTPTPTPSPTPAPSPAPPSGGLIVGSGGYSSISQAVAAASAGQVISVRAGTYSESVVIDKPLTLQAYGDGPVWIDGGCSRQRGITVRASDVVLRGLGVKRTAEAGVAIENRASRVTVEGMTIQDFNCPNGQDQYRAGVAAWNSGSGIRIVNNTIRFRAELSGGPGGYGNGIWFKSTSSQPSGGSHYIAGNTIVGGYDGIGGEPEGDSRGSFDRDTVIEKNVIRDCWDDGIQAEGGAQNVRVRNNEIVGCATGIAFAAPMTGPLYVEGNYIHDLKRGPQGNLFCFKAGNSTSATIYLTGNRCYPGAGADGLKQTNGGLGPIVSRYNAFQVGRYVFEFSDRPPSGSSFDYDCLHTTDSGRFIKWGGSLYGDLASFRRATGQEPNGRETTDCSWLPAR